MIMAAEHINDDNFETVIADSKPTVVDFWAEWCSPCKQMAPHLDAVAESMSEKVRIAKINVDENPMAASLYGVQGLPTLMLFKNGKIVQTKTGAMSQKRIADWINENI